MDITLWMKICLLILGLIVVAAKDYYEILGVKREASDKEIKRRFRQLGTSKTLSLFSHLAAFLSLALKYHPDKNKEPKAEETFRSITEAYDVLSDATKRREYDRQGHQVFSSSHADAVGGFQFNMNEFFQHFDAAGAGHFQQPDYDGFGFHYDSLFDSDESDDEEYDSDFFPDGNHFGFGDFSSLFNDERLSSHSARSSDQRCRTITRQHGHTVSTVTECY